MSTPNPAQPAAVPRVTVATPEDAGSDETTPLLLWVVGGALVLLIFLAFLCVGFYFLGSLAAGHPLSDVLLTPAH